MLITAEQLLANETPPHNPKVDRVYAGGKNELETATTVEDETPHEKDLRLSRDHLHHAMASSSSNVVGVHYRVGKKIGEGSFGVIFEGTNLLNNQQVAIKFVRITHDEISLYVLTRARNQGKAMRRNCATNTGPTRF